MKKMKVAQKLIFTFSMILVLFLVTALFLMNKINTVMSRLEYFYEHPFQVTNAVRAIKSEFLTMRVMAKDILLDTESERIEQRISEIEACEAKVLADIDVIDQRYLGNSNDVSLLQEKFRNWQRIKDNAVALLRNGDRAAAQSLSVNEAKAAADELFIVLNGILEFANDKAAAFYVEADLAHKTSQSASIIILAAAFLLSGLLAVLLTRDITSPLRSLTGMIRHVEQGGEPALVDPEGRTDEMGRIIVSFNGMLDYLRTQKELRELAFTLERQKTLEQFRITLMSIGDAVISTDTDGKVVNMNATAERLTGWTLKEAQGLNINHVFIIVNAKTRAKAENPLEKVIRLGMVVGLANHTVLISKNGEQYHISDSAAPIIDNSGKLTGVVLVFRDVSEEYKKQEEIAYMSFHDKLTGLYNRAFFEEEIKRMNTPRQMPLSIIMADINGLKLINDAFGHQMGDKYLIAAAKTLKGCCRADDIIARWGGDEFVILLPRTSAEESQRICARISDACGSIEGFHIKLSMALGSAMESKARGDYQTTLKEAETNMYRHKLLESRSVRNAIVASLGNSLNEKNYSTEEHAVSMVDTCRETGVYLGMQANKIDELELLAKLHDIGKIAISEGILVKPGRLDDDEWTEMKKHVEIGYRIANSIAELEHISDGILSHHERWDGEGYPRGLAGTGIPYAARIICVADAYDAMTRGRPYKSAVSHEEAVTELRRCAGSQFDPDIVEAFIKANGAKPGTQALD